VSYKLVKSYREGREEKRENKAASHSLPAEMGGFASARGPQRMQTVAVSLQRPLSGRMRAAVSRPAGWVVVLALSKESCFFFCLSFSALILVLLCLVWLFNRKSQTICNNLSLYICVFIWQ